ncbi:MAG: class I SAM-dependent methyltransferase [Parcubacteria group bacterium]
MNPCSHSNQTTNRRHLLSRRLGWNNGNILAKNLIAGSIAETTIAQVKEKVNSGIYQMEECLCFCGSNQGILISEIDRYGFYYPLVICQNCGLIRANPRMNKEAFANFYATEYRDVYGASQQPIEELFKLRQEQHKQKYKEIVDQIVLPERAVIFDIGCDFGTMLEQFARNGHDVYGCDYGIDHLEYGRQKTRLQNLLTGGYESLESIGEKADLIILSHVVEHFLELEQALTQIRNLLKPNGICYVAVPGTLGIIKNSFLKNDIIGLLQNAHTYQFSLTSLQYVMECCGFSFFFGGEEIESFWKLSGSVRNKADWPPGESDLIWAHLRSAEKNS